MELPLTDDETTTQVSPVFKKMSQANKPKRSTDDNSEIKYTYWIEIKNLFDHIRLANVELKSRTEYSPASPVIKTAESARKTRNIDVICYIYYYILNK